VSFTTTGEPTFKWVLAAGTDGAHIDICENRACSVFDRQADLTSSATTYTPPSALSAGVHYWRLYGRVGSTTGTIASPVWEFVVGAGQAGNSTAWGTMPDFNGDGYADLAVGSGISKAYVYLSDGSKLSTTAQITLSGGSSYGRWLASAGDVDGDGYADLVIAGANLELHLGSATGIAATAKSTISTVYYEVAGLGDVNGDGYSDVIAVSPNAYGAHVFYGSASGLPSAPSATLLMCNPANLCNGVPGANYNTGTPIYSVAGGDVDGDGLADAILTEYWHDWTTNRSLGAMWVYKGVGPSSDAGGGISTTAAVTVSNPTAGFGWQVATPDLNGDGYADVVVGVPGLSGLSSACSVLVYASGGTSGTPASPTTTITGASNALLGTSVARGDVNGDGYDDLAVGADGASVAYLYAGSSTGVSTTANSIAYSGADTNNDFGISVLGGDVNGDHYSDVMVAADTAYVPNGQSCHNGGVFQYDGASSTAPTLSVSLAQTVAGPTAGCYTTNFGVGLGR
jgi:hypothetical protein